MREMVCPFYRNGVCMSPVLGEPRHDRVIKDVCEGDESVYTKCRYFPPQGRGLEAFQPANIVGEKPYPLLHFLERRVDSACPEYSLSRHESVYIAYCRVLDRLLTKYEVENCEKYPDTCPIRRYSTATQSAGT